MKFEISEHGGQFQFWHMDCEGRKHESPMSWPNELTDNVKEFTCHACGKVGRVTMPVIATGSGTLEEHPTN